MLHCIEITGYSRNIDPSQSWIQGVNFQSSSLSIKLILCVSQVLSDNWESIGLLTLPGRRQRQGRDTDNQPKHPRISLRPTSLVLYFQGLKINRATADEIYCMSACRSLQSRHGPRHFSSPTRIVPFCFQMQRGFHFILSLFFAVLFIYFCSKSSFWKAQGLS